MDAHEQGGNLSHLRAFPRATSAFWASVVRSTVDVFHRRSRCIFFPENFVKPDSFSRKAANAALGVPATRGK
jgi:hypothetical protein